MNILEIGMQRGQTLGADLKLIELICKKMQRGKSTECIADEVEEPLEKVREICDAVKECGPECDYFEIYKLLEEKKVQKRE